MLLNSQAALECHANWQKNRSANAKEDVRSDTPNKGKWGKNP